MSVSSSSILVHFPEAFHRMGSPTFEVPLQTYVESLEKEIVSLAREPIWQERTVNSISFVGSSRWVLTPVIGTRLLTLLRDQFSIQERCKVSFQLSPAHFQRECVDELIDSGFTDVELCISSFDNRLLQSLGFWHREFQTEKALCDLSFRSDLRMKLLLFTLIPSQERESFRLDLRNTLAATTSGIRYVPISKVLTHPVTGNFEQEFVKRREVLLGSLDCIGMRPESLWNFTSKESSQCEPLGHSNVLGVGAGGHSRYVSDDGTVVRYTNANEAHIYEKKIRLLGHAEIFRKEASSVDLLHECISNALESAEGLVLEDIEKKFSLSLHELQPGLIPYLEELGYVETDTGVVKLTNAGVVHANGVISNFLLTEQDQKLLREQTVQKSQNARFSLTRLIRELAPIPSLARA